jgi:hypothetical protein
MKPFAETSYRYPFFICGPSDFIPGIFVNGIGHLGQFRFTGVLQANQGWPRE